MSWTVPSNPTRDEITPGEWTRCCDSYGRVRHSKMAVVTSRHPRFRNGLGGVRVASRIENWHDANLIAAAPELLAACKAALPLLEEYRERVMRGRITGDLLPGDCEPTAALRRAIAKAEG